MFPQFYFLTSISTNSSSFQQKILQIKKQLSSLNSLIGVVVVGGSQNSVKLGYEIFGQQNTKRKMFVEGLLRDRINGRKNQIIKFSQQQKLRYSKSYINFGQFMKQQSQVNLAQQDSQISFTQRINKLKHHLVHYKHHLSNQTGQKILLIAHKQVLNHLAATNYHQTGQPVNQLHLNQGQIDLVHLIVDWEESMRELRKGDRLFCA